MSHLLSEIEILIHVSHDNMEATARIDQFNAIARSRGQAEKTDPKIDSAIKQSVEAIKFVVNAVPNLLGWLDCEHINSATRRLEYWSESELKKWSELNTRSRVLRDAIQTELKEYYFYQYPKDRGKRLASWKDDWSKVIAAFPDTQWDIYAATDCYSLQHHTASVFHSMRIAERGLRALAAERRLRLPKDKLVEWATWQEIIRALDAEIKTIGAKKAGPTKDSALEFYSGARADLNGFKDEYRNAVMHVRAAYDEFQAIRALTNVHAFMDRLAAKIDATQKRIKWGRF